MMFIGLTFSSSSETARALDDHPSDHASGFGLAAGSEFAILCLLADGLSPFPRALLHERRTLVIPRATFL
jgi:hypothetical protein